MAVMAPTSEIENANRHLTPALVPGPTLVEPAYILVGHSPGYPFTFPDKAENILVESKRTWLGVPLSLFTCIISPHFILISFPSHWQPD